MSRPPTAPTRLGKLLSLPETRAAAIAEIAAAFRRAGTLPATAVELGAKERSLKRYVATYPDLRAAIEAVRAEPPPADEKAQLDRLDRLHRIQRCPRLARPHHAALALAIEAARIAAEDAIEALPPRAGEEP